MGLFNLFTKQQSTPQDSSSQKVSSEPQFQTFVLEPILTPSSLLDGGDGISDGVDDGSLFDSGIFTVGQKGQVKIDFLFDNGGYQGEVAIFSLEGMEQYEPGSPAFIQEAARRALSYSPLGHVVINDVAEGAKFSGQLFSTSKDLNSGPYLGVKTFAMRPGDEFGVMLVPDGTVQEVFANPAIDTADGPKRPLFSMATANPDDAFQVDQVADITGDGSTFAMEDLRVDDFSDRDYDDVIFQVKGAKGEASQLNEVVNFNNDWRESALGKEIVAYAKRPLFNSGVFTVEDTGQVSVDFLLDRGSNQGELAIFSLDGMDQLELGSKEFIQEAARRALSDSNLGHVVISEGTDSAKFGRGSVGEGYQGSKTFFMQPGDEFGVMLVPDGTVQEVFENPAVTGAKQPLFSMTPTEPSVAFQSKQIADVTGDGSTFAIDDAGDVLSDRDYNDLVFQVKGAKGKAVQLGEVINPIKDWRGSKVGQNLLAYVNPPPQPIVPEPADPIPPPPAPVTPPPEPPQSGQPLVGIIDTGFSFDDLDPDDLRRLLLGRDRVDEDGNPFLSSADADAQHGDAILDVIDDTQDEGSIWLGRGVGSGRWADSLYEFVDAARRTGQRNAVVNLSFDLTQVLPDGRTIPRYEFTPEEWAALAYAQENGVLIVAAAGNQGGAMSALGQASRTFDNIITVGAADGLERADYSNYGAGLDILAAGGTGEKAGTSVSAANVTAAVSQVWAANPGLSYRQVIDILKETATDLESPGWDAETGMGLLSLSAAVSLAEITAPKPHTPRLVNKLPKQTWSSKGGAISAERPAFKFGNPFKAITNRISSGINTVRNRVSRGVNTIRNRVSRGINTVRNRVSRGVNIIRNRVRRGVNTIRTQPRRGNTVSAAGKRGKVGSRTTKGRVGNRIKRIKRLTIKRIRATKLVQSYRQTERAIVAQKVRRQLTKGRVPSARPDGQRFSSYRAFRRAFGSAGRGKNWEHLVEQKAGRNARRFGTRINSQGNLLRVNAKFNQRKLGDFYSSKQTHLTGSGHSNVRNWAAGKSFNEQQFIKRKVIEAFGGKIKGNKIKRPILRRLAHQTRILGKVGADFTKRGTRRATNAVRRRTNTVRNKIRGSVSAFRSGVRRAANITKSGVRRVTNVNRNRIPTNPTKSRLPSGASRALSTAGRIVRPLAVVTDVISLRDAYRADGGRIGKNTAKTAGGVAGGWAGAAAGAAIGSAFGPVGTVVGGVVGGVVGSGLGSKIVSFFQW